MSDLNDLLQIDTPENVTFDYDIAGIGSRFLAALIDTALILIVQIILWGVVLLLASLVIESIRGTIGSWILAITGIISFIFLWGYYIFFEILWNGQTPGKRRIGLRVISVDGTPITPSEAVIRNLIRIIDFLPSAYGIGVITMFIDASSRRVGDLAAGTVVVHDRAVSNLNELSPVRISSLGISSGPTYLPENFPVEQVTEQELHVIEEYLSRRNTLANSHTLAKHILTLILTRLKLPTDFININRSESILAEIYYARQAETKTSGELK